jgi:hypothetical protein
MKPQKEKKTTNLLTLQLGRHVKDNVLQAQLTLSILSLEQQVVQFNILDAQAGLSEQSSTVGNVGLGVGVTGQTNGEIAVGQGGGFEKVGEAVAVVVFDGEGVVLQVQSDLTAFGVSVGGRVVGSEQVGGEGF